MILDFSSFAGIENHKRTNIQEPIEWFVLMVSSIACRFHKFLHVWQLCWLMNKARIVKSSVRKYETSKRPRGDGNKHWLCHGFIAIIHYCSEKLPILLHIPYQFKKLSRCHIGVYIDFGPVTIVSMPAPCRVANNTYWFRGTWLCPSELIVKVTY